MSEIFTIFYFLKFRDLDCPKTPVYSAATAHSSIINDIDGVGGLNVGQGAPEIVTGGRDGCVKIWDVRQKERPVAVLEPEMGQNRHDCWAVAFGNPKLYLILFKLKKMSFIIYYVKVAPITVLKD